MDEHVSRAVVCGLRSRGVDVQTLQEAGMLGASDLDHLERAANAGRVVFTQDEDFLKLPGSGIHHAGIAYAPQWTLIGKIIRGLMLIHQVLKAEEMNEHLEYL